VIHTVAIKLDSNPSLWLADLRVQQHLPPVHALAYMNLAHHAHTLTGTTGSEYVDGEFSYVKALKRVPHLTEDALDAMLDAELVTVVDGDRWRVEYVTPQTSHQVLQERADTYQAAADARKLRRAEKLIRQVRDEEDAERKRSQNAERQRKHRLSKVELGKEISEGGVHNPEPVTVGGGSGHYADDEPPF